MTDWLTLFVYVLFIIYYLLFITYYLLLIIYLFIYLFIIWSVSKLTQISQDVLRCEQLNKTSRLTF